MLFNFDVMNTYDFSILKIYFFLNMIIDKWEINLFIKILLIIVIKYRIIGKQLNKLCYFIWWNVIQLLIQLKCGKFLYYGVKKLGINIVYIL